MPLRFLLPIACVCLVGLSLFGGCDSGTAAPPEAQGGYTTTIDAGVAFSADPIATTALDEVVSDFESQTLSFRLSRGSGHFAPDAETVSLEVTAGGFGDSGYALHATMPEGDGGVSAWMTPEGVSVTRSIDYSSCEGLTFSVRAATDSDSQSVVVEVVGEGGAATTSVNASADWQLVELAWDDFESGGSVQDVLATLQFLGFETDSAAELWLDDVRLVGCELVVLNPAIPVPEDLGTGPAPAGSPVAKHGQLRVENARLVDQSGEPVQLKGISSHWLNWETGKHYSQDKAGLEWLRDNWNMSLFRIAMGVEEDGGYLAMPTRELGKVETIVQNAIDLGIYVIVDWHSHKAEQYVAEARGFFRYMAEKYGNAPNLIWETFNEPTQQQWASTLKPYHESVVATIRSVDPDNVIVLGNPRWSQLPINGAEDPVGASNIMYTLHFYTCTHASVLRTDADAAMAAGAAVFVTEWGATNADGGLDGIVCETESIPWLEWMEANKISWAAWKWDQCADASCLLSPSAVVSDGLDTPEIHGHASLVREWMLR